MHCYPQGKFYALRLFYRKGVVKRFTGWAVTAPYLFRDSLLKLIRAQALPYADLTSHSF